MCLLFSYDAIAIAMAMAATAANNIMDNKYSAGQMISANIIYAFIFNVDTQAHTHRIIHS